MGVILKHRPYLYLARNSTHYQVVIGVAISSNELLSISQNGREFTCSITTGSGDPAPDPVIIREDFTIPIPDPDWTDEAFLELIMKLDGTTLDIDYGTLRMTAADTEEPYQTGAVVPMLLVEIEDAESESPVFVPRILVHPSAGLRITEQNLQVDEDGLILYNIEIDEGTGLSVTPENMELNEVEGVEDPLPANHTEVTLAMSDKRRRVKIEHLNATPSI